MEHYLEYPSKIVWSTNLKRREKNDYKETLILKHIKSFKLKQLIKLRMTQQNDNYGFIFLLEDICLSMLASKPNQSQISIL